MMYFLKIAITSLLIVLISEVSKRSSVVAATIASLPLTSILAITWLYIDTKNIQQVASLSIGIFWLVIPSLIFFISLPFFIKKSWGFFYSMSVALFLTMLCYFLILGIFKFLGIKI